ncbi:MAG: transposase [Ignavibacteriaceae bacterium]|nr:transposase [Ignavibacteriaceae bacterium]
MSKYMDLYRSESIRLQEWDYSNPWWYYVTIVTKNHFHHFGYIKDGKMHLNNLGKTVQEEWEKTAVLRPTVSMDEFIIMPNHIHGIIILSPPETPEKAEQKSVKAEFSKPVSNSLSVILNQFKGAVKRWAKKNGLQTFEWHQGFYDRIIRNEKELYHIRKYIIENPLKWEFEKGSIENLDL